VPLPEGVACFTVAATTNDKRSPLADRLVGDGLVPPDSALGRHKEPKKTLIFPEGSQLTVFRTNHLELLTSPEVGCQVVQWLGLSASDPSGLR